MVSRRTALIVPGAAAGTVLAGAALAPLTGRAPDLTPPGGRPAITTAGRGRLLLTPDPGGSVRSAEARLAAGVTERLTDRFTMVGATWAEGAAPDVEVRVRRDGAWGPWVPLPALAHGDHDEGRLSGTEPLWVGGADGVRTRVRGQAARDLRLVLIDPRHETDDAPVAPEDVLEPTADLRTTASTGSGSGVPAPRLFKRRAWGADESWRDGGPYYNRVLKQVHVHHTVTANDYTRAEVPGLIRGMYRYHTQSLGWSDIGYNFLVDRFGRVWVGRAGGPARRVRGAHTLGFNHQSTGVAVIGNYETAELSSYARRGVVQLSAWKLDRAGIDPTSYVWSRSKGSDRYPYGERVRLPAIDGHRDTNETACPGDDVYGRIPGIRRRASRRINRFS